MGIVSGKTAEGLVNHAQRALSEKWWYVWGTFGNLLTQSLLDSKAAQYPQYNGGANKAIHAKHIGEMVSDCVGLIKGYCMWDDKTDKPVYDVNLDYNTGMMYNAAKKKGIISTIPEKPGICVYMQGHVGVYIGGGWVIECAGGRGVVKTPLKGNGATAWTAWFECPFIDYEAKTNESEGEEDMAVYLPFTVKVNEYRDYTLAEAQRKKIGDKGYYTFIISIKGEAHFVCVGRFGTEKEAQVTCDDLKKKGFTGKVESI